MEFQMETDVGLYPGVITVDETGVLCTELGGSKSYKLSCLDSSITAPASNDTQTPAAESSQASVQDSGSPESVPEKTAEKVPVSSILFFGISMAVAIGSLVTMQILKKRKAKWKQDTNEKDAL